MIITRWRPAALGAALLLAACSSFSRRTLDVSQVDGWSAPSAAAARHLISLYGAPTQVKPNKLVWAGKGPWLRTVVWNRPGVYRSPRDFDLILQTVKYPATRSQAADMVAFSDALIVDLDRGEVSSRAAREDINFLNLNLADEVARKLRTPEDAQASLRRISALAAAGKEQPYMTGLRFNGR